MIEIKIKKLKITPLNKNRKEKIKSQKRLMKYISRHFKLVKNIKQITTLPKKDESIHIVTQAAFNAWTFIPYISETEVIKNMYVSTYAISHTVIDAISVMLTKSLIETCSIIICSVNVKRMSEIIIHLDRETERHNKFTWKHCSCHAKVTLIETANNHYVIEGSGNFNDNAQIEQYMITNSRELFLFHKNWMDSTGIVRTDIYE